MTTFTKEQLISHARESVSYLEDLKGRASKEGEDCKVVLEMVERELELARIALASLAAEPIAVSDDMAYAFHHALSDSSLGADEVEEIKTGLRAAFSNVTAQPAPVVPDEIEPDDGNTFDYVDGWNACRAAMLHGAEPVSQTYKLPPLSSSEVNDAAWKLHNMLTEHGPLNGRQFNNLKGCFYEALKVAMRNYPVTPDSWISCSERMPNDKQYVWCWGKSYGWTECNTFEGYYDWSRNKWWAVTDDGEEPASKVTHWMPLPEPPQEVK
ncbi:DUF551 domain-containing protein [Escherichia coli]|jgi:hypothetical protein|nr:DUF551 domain-containing protein [Escherichia coli]EFW6870433.1 DUF551 domain-containing protein [Shigella sonnei]EJK9917154.1 DUF551 domain-containing protein [Escherichia coli]EJV1935941.1 DUF551 domain-containing protein [Escherichia coli]EJZ0285193.1 DUF551 domain-containing protein [Escherichia coli]